MAISVSEYEKALISLEKVMLMEKTDITRDAAIQRFEFCVELGWKTSKKIMGTGSTAPKQVVREMAQSGLITDVVLWLEAIDQRNLSSHTYNEELAEKVYQFIKKFLPHAKSLLTKITTK